jgi:predicted transcriptional regulator
MPTNNILEMSVDLAKTHLLNSPMDAAEIPGLIQRIYRTLQDLSQGSPASALGAGQEDLISNGLVDANSPPPVINEDISEPDFRDLDPWLAHRLPRRVARKLNREESVHPSVFKDYLICLEDGEKVKLLRAYVRKRFGMSFAEYLDRWHLPDDYPAAPLAYLTAKREAAKASGLGYVTRGKRGGDGSSVGAGDGKRRTRNSAKT